MPRLITFCRSIRVGRADFKAQFVAQAVEAEFVEEGIVTDFSGAEAKIVRAGNQVDALSANIETFRQTIVQSIVHKADKDVGEQQWVFRGPTPHVPIEWSVQAGEILYNLRSALDHLVWQLVIDNGQHPKQTNQFPIVDDETVWLKSRTQNRMAGVADRTRKQIHYLQPFNHFLCLPGNGTNRPVNAQVFRTLRELCNIDKHRHLNLIAAITVGIRPVVFGENQPPRRSSSRPLTGTGPRGKIEQNMIVLSIDDVEQELDPDFLVEVCFEYPTQDILTANAVVQQLRACHEAVSGAIELLRRS